MTFPVGPLHPQATTAPPLHPLHAPHTPLMLPPSVSPPTQNSPHVPHLPSLPPSVRPAPDGIQLEDNTASGFAHRKPPVVPYVPATFSHEHANALPSFSVPQKQQSPYVLSQFLQVQHKLAEQNQQLLQMVSTMVRDKEYHAKHNSTSLYPQPSPPNTNLITKNNQTVQFGEVLIQEYIQNSHADSINAQLLEVLNQQNTNRPNVVPPTINNSEIIPNAPAILVLDNGASGMEVPIISGQSSSQAPAPADKALPGSVINLEEEISLLAPNPNTTTLPTVTKENQVGTHCVLPHTTGPIKSVAENPIMPDTQTAPAKKPSYASFLRPKAVPPTIPVTQLPTPYKKGHLMAVKLDENVYQRSLQQCQNNLHGRLILKHGNAPVKAIDLHLSLSSVWNTKEQWTLTPIGKGYYTLRFSNGEDKQKVWSSGQVNLSQGIFNLFQWTKDFKPSQQKQTRAHIWARFHEVPEEYLHYHLILSMANVIGFPVNIDPYTLKKDYGHYCRVEIDVDLKAELPNSILVEREGFNFEIDVTYERLPDFCSHCSVIGHLVTACRSLKKAQQPFEHISKNLSKPVAKNTSQQVHKQLHTTHIPSDNAPFYEQNVTMAQAIVSFTTPVTNLPNAGEFDNQLTAETIVPCSVDQCHTPPAPHNDHLPVNYPPFTTPIHNSFTPLNGRFWSDLADEDPILSSEAAADEHLAEIIPPVCIQLLEDTNISIFDQATPLKIVGDSSKTKGSPATINVNKGLSNSFPLPAGTPNIIFSALLGSIEPGNVHDQIRLSVTE
ncbi:hypothetical protein LguiA_008498 [Lonicera macranthoides]